MSQNVLQESFSSGQLSGAWLAKIGDQRRANGCPVLHNADLTSSGSAVMRRGTRWWGANADVHAPGRLIPFITHTYGVFVIELSANKLRVRDASTKALVDIGGTPNPIKLDTVYAQGDLRGVTYDQTETTLSFHHESHPQCDLSYDGTSWSFVMVDFGKNGIRLNSKKHAFGITVGIDDVDATRLVLLTPVDYFGREVTGGWWFRVGGDWTFINEFVNARSVRASPGSRTWDGAPPTYGGHTDWAGPYTAEESSVVISITKSGGGTGLSGTVVTLTTAVPGFFSQRSGHVIDVDHDNATLRIVQIIGPSNADFPIAGTTDASAATAIVIRGAIADGTFGRVRWFVPGQLDIPTHYIQASAAEGEIYLWTTEDTFDPLMASATGQRRGSIFMSGGAIRIEQVYNKRLARCSVLKAMDHAFASYAWSLGLSDYTGYPRASCLLDDRRWRGGVKRFPAGIYGSRTGHYNDYTLGPNASDGLAFTLLMEKNGRIAWLRSKIGFLVGTEEQEIVGSAEVTTPNSFGFDSHSDFGARPVQPINIEGGIAYVSRSGKEIRLIDRRGQDSRYTAPSLTDKMKDFFTSPIVEMAYMREPQQLAAILEDGRMAVLTMFKEEEVDGWSPWSGIEVYSACVVPNAGRDELWLMVHREIAGSDAYYVEVVADDVYFDSYTVQFTSGNSVPATGYLQGLEIYAYTDTQDLGTATAGAPSTVFPGLGGGTVTFGIPIEFELQPNIPEAQDGKGITAGRLKSIDNVMVRLERSRGGGIGRFDFQTEDPPFPGLRSEWVRMPGTAINGRDPRVRVTTRKPFRFEVTSMNIGVTYGW